MEISGSEPDKHSVNIKTEDLINIYVREWVLSWCRKYHPEVFIEAEKFIKDNLKKDD